MRTSLEKKILLSLWGDKSEEIYEIVREQEKLFPTVVNQINPDELVASMAIRRVTSKLQKMSDKLGLNIYLSGRDCWLYHVQLKKWGVAHIYNPTLNRQSIFFKDPRKAVKPIGNVIFFDTGFMGSIFRSLQQYNLIGAQSVLLLHCHEENSPEIQLGKGGNRHRFTRRIVLQVEHGPIPWTFAFSSVQNVSSPKELNMVGEMKAQTSWKSEKELTKRYMSATSLPSVLRLLRLQLLT